jgi:hypothetical protein
MIERIKHIISLLLVVALLSPSIVKLEHHHDINQCHAKTEKHLHTQQKVCLVCNFEFSVYSINQTEQYWAITDIFDGYILSPYQYYYSNSSKYSFLLRGPPSFKNPTT